MAYSQMKEYHSPFLKRKVLFVKDAKWEFPLREEGTVYDIIQYIKQETSYDVKLIYENISRVQNLKQEMSEQEKIEIHEEYDKLIKEANTEERKIQAYTLKNQIYDYEKFRDLIEN